MIIEILIITGGNSSQIITITFSSSSWVNSTNCFTWTQLLESKNVVWLIWVIKTLLIVDFQNQRSNNIAKF